jgi:hypothetical protein
MVRRTTKDKEKDTYKDPGGWRYFRTLRKVTGTSTWEEGHRVTD